MLDNKRCPHCSQTLPACDFYKAPKDASGLSSYCKTCEKKIKCYKRKHKIGYYGKPKKYNPLLEKERSAKKAKKVKELVVSHYSAGSCCVACGYKDIRALSVDHLDSNGADHRRRAVELKGSKMYRWLKREGFPEGYQILCMNCQFIKRHERQEFGNQILGTVAQQKASADNESAEAQEIQENQTLHV